MGSTESKLGSKHGLKIGSKMSSKRGAGHRLDTDTDVQGSTETTSAAQQRPDPKVAAAQAAEQRLKANQARGVVGSNPKSGRLAAQVEASKAAPKLPEPRQEERIVWD
ncbi:hypothetical protein BC835DRAFT_935975 [Cytidiella melzeri]|nr:hypothetical protein BC835DRAFT_935975 [Cytidiella melzeri]